MKKLLQINVVVNSGSTGRIAEELGKLVISNGWNSYIAFARNEQPSESNLIKIGNDWDIKLHGIETRLFDKHGLSSRRATILLINQIKEINPDIIHLHNLHGYYINIEILFNYLSSINIPIIWTVHDCWPITGHCSHFEFADCNKWETQCFNCPQKKEYPKSILFDRSRKNYQLKKKLFNSVSNITLIPVSNWLEKIIKKSFLANNPILTIHNGIDTELFSPTSGELIRNKYNLYDDFIILGVASIWSPRKGLADFIELSKKIKNKTKIILVGLNSKQLKSLPKNIIGINRTESIKELTEYYSASNLFINPTYEDNFPTTNLEAMSCGTPVLTYNTGGSSESINDKTGFVVEQGDIQGILNVIDIVSKKGKNNLTKDCRNHVIGNFKHIGRFDDYFNLYNKLLNSDN